MPPCPPLSVYKGVLGIYTATRQGHQWSDPDAEPARGGRFFVLAWLALPVVLSALEVGRLRNPPPPPIQPVDLNSTLNWVIGYYVFGKASTLTRLNGYRPFGLGKTLDARLAAKGLPAAPAPLPENKRKMMEVLALAVDVLGGVCIFNMLREAITPPNRSAIDIQSAYLLALVAYAGTNRWRKWTDPGADSPRSGCIWVLLWLAVLVLIKGLAMISPDNIIAIPEHLATTVLCVCSLYGLGRLSDFYGWNPLGPARGQQPFPAPGQPKPRPAPGPKPADPAPNPPAPGPPPAEGGQAPGSGANQNEKLDRVVAASEQAGEFGLADIDAATRLGYETVRHWIGVLVGKGWVEKVRHGRYRWKGRGDG